MKTNREVQGDSADGGHEEHAQDVDEVQCENDNARMVAQSMFAAVYDLLVNYVCSKAKYQQSDRSQ